MVKKIGNNVYMILLLSSLIVHAQDDIRLKLEIKNTQDVATRSARVGVPFIVELGIQGNGSTPQITIDGVDQFEVLNQGSSQQTMRHNNVVTHFTTRQFLVRSQHVGTYTIGPARVVIQGKEYTSQAITLKVEKNDSSHKQSNSPQLVLDVTKSPIVVGQRVPLSIRFYAAPEIKLLGTTPPEFKNCIIEDPVGPFAGVDRQQGRDYIEFRMIIIPQQEGELVLPAIKGVYAEKEAKKRSHTIFDILGMFQDDFVRKEIYSNTLTLPIQPLPPYQGTVDAVGSFSALHASVNQTSAQQGEGIVYTLQVVGEDANDSIHHPTLMLPDSITSYASKSGLHKNADDTFTKTFEYIIQARQPGDVTIPEQQFVFYDTDQQAYYTLHSSAITLHIAPSSMPAKTVQALVDQEQQPGEISLLPLDEFGAWAPRHERCIPLPWFIVIFIIPLLAVVMQLLIKKWSAYRVRTQSQRTYKKAFSHARSTLARLKKQNRPEGLYDLFIDLFAARIPLERTQITAALMHEKLQLARFSQDALQRWRQFFIAVQEQFFSKKIINIQECELIFSQAEQWVAQLENYL